MKKPKSTWHLYILECADGSLYTGITTDVSRRIKQHESGEGAKYTRGRAPLKLLYTKKFKSRSAASKRELEVKKMSREEKLDLIKALNS
jgi:putative endonuclease